MRRLVIGSALIASLLGVPATPTAAETTAVPNGNVVTIPLQVDVFAGKNVRTGPDGKTRIDKYFKAVINDSWGAAFGRLPYKNCFLFKLELDLKLFDINDKGRKGSHKLYVGTETRGWNGVGWDGVKETSPTGDGDGTRSFENDRKGDIPANAPPTVVAHEFGHLLGLGDDRENETPKAGRDLDTVMIGNVPGVDLTQTPRIDQNLIDRIGKVIEQHLKNQGKKLPKCETAQMHLDSRVSGPGYLCTDSWEVTLAFQVEDREVAGAGIATGSGATCSFPIITPILTEASFEVTGRRAGDNFELSLRLSGYGDGVEWGAFPCTATGGDRPGPSFKIPASGAEAPVSFVGANCGSTSFEEFRADGTVRLTSADVA